MQADGSSRSTIGWVATLAVFGAALAAVPPRARCAGFEDSVAGTVALGRAAGALRVNDFMATWQNPANLALIPGADLGVELRLPLFLGCFDRAKDNSVEYRTEDRSRGFGGAESFDKVCNHGARLPAGNLGWAEAFDSGVGYGIGFFTPAAVPRLAFGDDLIVTQLPLATEVHRITPGGTESPNRFLLLERATTGGFLMAGVAAQPNAHLRFGLSAGIGFAQIHNVSMASVQGGTFVDQEVLIDLRAYDWLIPRVTASVVVTPLDALEIGLGVTSQSSIQAEGDIELTANGIVGAPLTDCRAQGAAGPGPHCRIEHARLSVPFPPFEATFSVRYASRRQPRKRALEPLKDERWDIELAGYWSQTSHIDEFTLQLYDEQPGTPGAPRLAFSSAPEAAPLGLPQRANIPRYLKDTFGVALGGDINLIPAKLALRVGLSYETRAVPAQYMNIDIWPLAKLGLHAGASLALGRCTLSLGYAHVFYQPVEVAVGSGRVTEIVSQNQATAQAVNEGGYEAGLDVISLQANAAF